MLERALTWRCVVLSLALGLAGGCASTDAAGEPASSAEEADDVAQDPPANGSGPAGSGPGPSRARPQVARDLPDLGETDVYFRAHGARALVDRGQLRGDLVLAGPGLTKEGEGPGETVIDGDVEVRGDGWTLRGITITGDLRVRGDRNDLTGLEVLGRVDARGANNTLPAR
ncbi:MAG: hypothetical protein M9894_22535 [Planctomycetes bacterium]|nr:hypothetical protein [Planctomycetota bacterium]